jgi:hypothetical protein
VDERLKDERLRAIYERDVEPGERVFDPDSHIKPFWPDQWKKREGPTEWELSGRDMRLRWEGYQSWLRKQRGEPDPEPPKRPFSFWDWLFRVTPRRRRRSA